MFDKKIIGQNIRYLRTLQVIKQEELARAIGISKQMLSNIETGYRDATLEVAYKVADYFDVSLDYLVGRSDHMDGITPIALRAREKELLEKLPPHLTSEYHHAKNDQSLSELERTIKAFEDMDKTGTLESSFISKVLDKLQLKKPKL